VWLPDSSALEDGYGGSSSTDPMGPLPWDPDVPSPSLVFRGGNFDLSETDTSGCQVALHLRSTWTYLSWNRGFRAVRTAP